MGPPPRHTWRPSFGILEHSEEVVAFFATNVETVVVDRAVRIAELWSWLPAFRTVAETEHLPTAARAMSVSTSALSRAVSLLEDAIGGELFERRGRRLHLNPRGQRLLAAVRDGMRRIDDALRTAPSEVERIRIAGQGAWLRLLVLPASEGFDVHQVVHGEGAVEAALLRGDVDLAIVEAAVPGDGVRIDMIGIVPRALCRGPRSSRRGSGPAHAICTDGPDPWPADKPRRVTLRSSHLDLVASACLERGLAAVLPVPIARTYGLRAVREPAIGSSTLYLVRRAPLGPDPLEHLVTAILAHSATILDRTG